MKAERVRVSGLLGHGQRGLILTSDEDLWVVETDLDVADLVGTNVTIEGVKAGFDRLIADWIGKTNESL